MKNLSLTFCLAIATLLASVGSGFALPTCPGSPFTYSQPDLTRSWNNCVGRVIFSRSKRSYFGEWKLGKKDGLGVSIASGNVYLRQEGLWENDDLIRTQKTPYSKKLKSATTEKPRSVLKEKTGSKRNLEKEFGLSLYGSFLHSEKVPNALFFFDYIEQNDSFEFRKALRNHDVDLIVLSSPGGLVWEGLSIAGIINDKGLNVYVPKSSVKGDGNCASACSFMFFAGATRNVEGNLGVHQFLSKDSKKKKEVGDIQKTAQFTVSEIIGFLNEFETPAWVYERMFQQSEMYYFKETELVQLETEVSDELSTHYEKSEKFITDLSKAFAEVAE